MKNFITTLVAFILILTSLNAQFSGYYHPSNWTETETGCVTNGWVDATGAPASLLIMGPDNPFGCGSSVISLSIAAQFCGTISFDWAYTTTDCNGPYWDRFGYSINGSPVQLSTWTVQYGAPGSQSGSASFEVSGGDMIAFYMDAIDSYCGAAWVTLTNFSAPDAICYGDDGELKVQLCHKGNTICVAPASVPAHMAHGDLLGSCFELAGCEENPPYQVAQSPVADTDEAALETALNLRSSVERLHQTLAIRGVTANADAATAYPNPAGDAVNLNTARLNGPVDIRVFTANGQQVMQATAIASPGQPIPLRTSGLANGQYEVRIESVQGMILTKRIQVLHPDR